MSIIFNSNDFCVVDHRKCLSNLYREVEISKEENRSFSLNSKLFCIKCERKPANRKRKKESNDVEEEIALVKQMYEKSLQYIPEELKSKISENQTLSDTEGDIRDLAKKLFETTTFSHCGVNGGNNSNRTLKCKIMDQYFLLPQKSRFFCGCVKEQCKKLAGNKFDILIADPPWWNKFIRRLKKANDKLSYEMMYNEDIALIPVKDLLAPNCLVAVWCTNSPSNINAVKEMIFPAWGIEYVTTWYWMKITSNLQPLCEFGTGSKKQPYERLILGKTGQLKRIPEVKMFMSVPSALHSHKPPILDLLSPYVVTESPETLELFARYLLPNTTSVGYEPLKWQHISLYEHVS